MVIKTIVVATDFSELSHTLLMQARELARALGAHLHLVHVVDEFGSRGVDVSVRAQMKRLQATLERGARARINALAAQEQPGTIGDVLTSPSPADAIASYARNLGADLIVVGTHQRTTPDRFVLGSVAGQLLRIAPCPVLTIRCGLQLSRSKPQELGAQAGTATSGDAPPPAARAK